MTYQEFTQRYDYNPNLPIDSGGFGKVYKAFDKVRDRDEALKICPITADKKAYRLKREVELAKRIPPYENIACYEECYTFQRPDGEYDIAVMQYYPEGNLGNLLKNKKLTQAQKEDLVKGLFHGIAHLHKHKTIYRDAKPANTLISKRGDRYIPKLTDFGLSKQYQENPDGEISNSSMYMSKLYASPEQYKNEPLLPNTDLWSLGCMVYEILMGSSPFYKGDLKNISEESRLNIYKKIAAAELPKDLDTVPEPYQKLIRSCLVADKKQRIKSAEDCLEILSPKRMQAPEPNPFSDTEPTRTKGEDDFSVKDFLKAFGKGLLVIPAAIIIAIVWVNLPDTFSAFKREANFLFSSDTSDLKKDTSLQEVSGLDLILEEQSSRIVTAFNAYAKGNYTKVYHLAMAESEKAWAIFILIKMYTEGLGVEKNPEKVQELLDKMRTLHGDPVEIMELQELIMNNWIRKVTTQQLEKAGITQYALYMNKEIKIEGLKPTLCLKFFDNNVVILHDYENDWSITQFKWGSEKGRRGYYNLLFKEITIYNEKGEDWLYLSWTLDAKGNLVVTERESVNVPPKYISSTDEHGNTVEKENPLYGIPVKKMIDGEKVFKQIEFPEGFQ